MNLNEMIPKPAKFMGENPVYIDKVIMTDKELELRKFKITT